MPYGIGSWDADTLGNHRAVLQVAAPAGAVCAHIPWRRRDADPQRKHLIVVEGTTGGRVLNVARLDVNREFGDIVFEAPSAGAVLRLLPAERRRRPLELPESDVSGAASHGGRSRG